MSRASRRAASCAWQTADVLPQHGTHRSTGATTHLSWIASCTPAGHRAPAHRQGTALLHVTLAARHRRHHRRRRHACACHSSWRSEKASTSCTCSQKEVGAHRPAATVRHGLQLQSLWRTTTGANTCSVPRLAAEGSARPEIWVVSAARTLRPSIAACLVRTTRLH